MDEGEHVEAAELKDWRWLSPKAAGLADLSRIYTRATVDEWKGARTGSSLI